MRRILTALFLLPLVLALTSGCALSDIVSVEPSYQLGPDYRGTYDMDKQHASVTFKVSHLGFSHFTGRFDDIDAHMSFDTKDPTTSQLTVTIKAASVDPNLQILQDVLRGPDFFNVAKFPDITFKSRQIIRLNDHEGRVIGDLTLLGVTKPLALAVTFNGGAVDPFNSSKTLGFSATAKIKRSDFGMTSYIPLVGDEVELMVEAEMTKVGNPY